MLVVASRPFLDWATVVGKAVPRQMMDIVPSKNPKSRSGRRTPAGQALTDLILIIFKTNVELVNAGPLIVRDQSMISMRWLLLNALQYESKTAAKVGREIGLTRQGALLNVQILRDLGYVALQDNAEDQRAKNVALTAAGLEKLEEMNRFAATWVNQLAMHFDKAQIDMAVELVDKLRTLVPTSICAATERPSRITRGDLGQLFDRPEPKRRAVRS